jgi:hypothetical protein
MPVKKAAKKKKKEANEEIHIVKMDRLYLDYWILGVTPLICHAISVPSREILLVGSDKSKKATTVKHNIKHNPPEEYRGCFYLNQDPSEGPLFVMQSISFKKALCSSALDIEGVAKTEMGRLTYVVGDFVWIYGVPKLFMTTVRTSDKNRTPDIRTRPIFPEWCCKIRVGFVTPNITRTGVSNLLGNSGMIRGVGDGRPEKGTHSYGQFTLVKEDDDDWNRIRAEQGRIPQLAAYDNPEYYDSETAALMDFWYKEVRRRGLEKEMGIIPNPTPAITAIG